MTAIATSPEATTKAGAPDIALHRRQFPASSPTGSATDIALYRSKLQAAYQAAVDRAAKVESRERVVSEFRLGGLIDQFEDEARDHAAAGDLAESITLSRVVIALKQLIPTR